MCGLTVKLARNFCYALILRISSEGRAKGFVGCQFGGLLFRTNRDVFWLL